MLGVSTNPAAAGPARPLVHSVIISPVIVGPVLRIVVLLSTRLERRIGVLIPAWAVLSLNNIFR
jgi:hypothetical protein